MNYIFPAKQKQIIGFCTPPVPELFAELILVQKNLCD